MKNRKEHIELDQNCVNAFSSLIRSHECFKPYRDLIVQARGARLNDDLLGTHVHHIIPRCLGGGDEAENLVRVSVRMHRKLHWVLADNMELFGHKRATSLLRYASNKMEEEWHFKSSPLHECDLNRSQGVWVRDVIPSMLQNMMDNAIRLKSDQEVISKIKELQMVHGGTCCES